MPDREASRRRRPAKTAQRVAREIERDVMARGWPLHERLGSSAELEARYGASRAIVREAIHIVERHGVARMQLGRTGGLVVVAPARDALIETICDSLEFAGLPDDQLRIALAVLLDLALSSGEEPEPETDSDHPLAQLTARIRNPILQLFLRCLLQFAFRSRRSDQWEGRVMTAAAIALRAPADASARESLLDALTEPGADAQTAAQDDGKRAVKLANRLRDRIVGEDLAVGTRLGSEADLMLRYRVSRATLREAVRILEHHGLAAMRTGFEAGLVVTSEEAGLTLDAAVTFLHFMRFSRSDLLEARRVIEAEVAALAATTVKFESLRALSFALLDEFEHPSAHTVAVLAFHLALSRMCGNAALNLFNRIGINLTYPLAVSQVEAEESGLPEQIRHNHAAIFRAIAAADPDLARQCVLDHRQLMEQHSGDWVRDADSADPPSVAPPEPAKHGRRERR